ncbi:MAG: ribonuclease P protein component [Gemmatimonadales bacterium]|nr:ribonuclease P protein component [Gemmatimonadales bacterium]
MIWNPNSLDHSRMGLVVPKYRSTAVARNRLRRRLRELWRTEVQPVQGPSDLVIRARPAAYQAPFATLRGELLDWRDGLTAGS